MNFVIGGFHALVQVFSKDGSKLAWLSKVDV
jgi:hypothetical protein